MKSSPQCAPRRCAGNLVKALALNEEHPVIGPRVGPVLGRRLERVDPVGVGFR
jgi:hypothetical protein